MGILFLQNDGRCRWLERKILKGILPKAVKNSCAIVGGGISGLAATYYLQQNGIKAELIECGEQLGGRAESLIFGNRLINIGGKNIGKDYKLFRNFTKAMGDNPYEYFGLNSSQVRDGKLLTLDSKRRLRSMAEFLTRGKVKDAFRFLTLCASIKLSAANGYLGSPRFNTLAKRFDHKPVSEYFSEEFCDTVIRPMAVRMNGAEPDEIYMGNLGSNLRMLLDTYEQLRKGMNHLLDQFARTANIRLGTQVESLLIDNEGVFGLRMVGKDGIVEQEYNAVILATPANVAADLVASHDPALAQTLKRVRYYPVTVIVAEYNRAIFSPEVRALVFGDDEPLSNAGAYGFNDRHIVRYTFSGRTARRYIESGIESEKLLAIGEKILNRYIPVQSSERIRFVSRYFSTGLCAYTPRYDQFLKSVQNRLANLQGLYLTGDYLQGASIEACFRSAKMCVENVLQDITRNNLNRTRK